MADNEKIIELLDQIHHENCFMFSTLATLLAQDETITEMAEKLTDAWDREFKRIVEK